MMRSKLAAIIAPALGVAACQAEPEPRDSAPKISVRSAEQDQLHKLNEADRAIALKRAIHASGFRCERVASARFVQAHENLDMWTASCSDGRNWAIYAGPDGSAQVRDCVDVAEAGLPECKVSEKPDEAPTG